MPILHIRHIALTADAAAHRGEHLSSGLLEELAARLLHGLRIALQLFLDLFQPADLNALHYASQLRSITYSFLYGSRSST